MKGKPITTPVAGAQDARMMLGYVLLYPSAAMPFAEDLAAVRMPDRMLGDIRTRFSELLLQSEQPTPEQMLALLSDEEKNALSAELEMIRKSGRTADEMAAALKGMMTEFRRRALQDEIAQKTAAYFEKPSPEVWERIKVLKKEIENLQENE